MDRWGASAEKKKRQKIKKENTKYILCSVIGPQVF